MRMFGKRPDLSKPVFQHPLSWLLISDTLAIFPLAQNLMIRSDQI